MSLGSTKQAEDLFKAAQKRTKKGLFNWNPNWDEAATEFQRAAGIFASANSVDRATEAYTLCAEAHSKAGNLYSAGQAMDNLGTLLKDTNDPARLEAAAEAFAKASRYFAEGNKPQAQADALMKAARAAPAGIEGGAAAKWITEGITVLEDNERWHMTRDLYRALAVLHIRGGRYMDAIAVLKRQSIAFEKLEMPDAGAKSAAEIVILALALKDPVLAGREFQAMSGGEGYAFRGSKYEALVYSLVDAADRRDPDAMAEAAKATELTFLLPDVARLVKKLVVDGATAPAAPAASSTAPLTAAAPAAPTADDEIDTR